MGIWDIFPYFTELSFTFLKHPILSLIIASYPHQIGSKEEVLY